MIGVDEDVANIDAEGIEHHLHPQTLKKLREFIRNHKKEPRFSGSTKSLSPFC
jgi:Mn-dependent DtxR family transcriptional regulator